jgi:hypothetical protein
MADNLTTQSSTPATVPASTQIATDEVSSVHYQKVKLVDGTADSATGIPGDATNGLDVDVTRVQGTVNVADGGGSLTVDGTVSVGNFPATQPVSGTVTIQDGGNSITVDDGAGSLTVDGTVAVSSVSGTVAVSGALTDTQLRASDVDVNITNTTVPVSGTFYPATQPVSGSVSVSNLPATQPVSGTVTVQDGGGSLTVDGTVGVSGTVTVDGSGTIQPVSASSLPLPTGAATSAKQPSIGTAGTPSADVISVQGVTGGKEVPISGSVSVTGTPTVGISGSSNTVKVDAGTAGTPAGSVVSVQGVASGTAVVTEGRGTAGTATGGVFTVQGVTGGTDLNVNTELPAAAALADGASNPTTPTAGAGNLVYNGTTWDRLRGDTTNGAWVQVKNTPTVTQTPAASGGLSAGPSGSPAPVISAASSTNLTTLKSTAGQLYGVVIGNSNASPRYVKFYNTTSATVGTTTPVLTILVPGNTSGAGVVASWDSGISLGGSGIAVAITTGVANNDTGTTTGTEVVVNAFWK